MNNIIYIQWANGYGGLEKITSYYENIFEERKPLVLLFEYHKTGFNYKDYKFIDKTSKIKFLFEYIKFVIQNKEKIFHFQIPETFLILLAYLFGVRKLVCQFHGCRTPRKFHEKIVWRFLETRIRIISNSNYTKNEIKKKYSATKNITVIPNYIDEMEFNYSKRNFDGGNFVVTYAGRLSKGKNLNLLLEIVKLIDDNNIEFRIYGDGPEKQNLLRKISELNIEDKVAIYPFAENISDIYKESHLFIFLSLYETFGNVVAEAILTGLPVLCYNIPPLAEFLNDDYSFILEKNPQLFASRINEIKNNYVSIIEKQEKNYSELKQFINNEVITQKLNNIYNQF